MARLVFVCLAVVLSRSPPVTSAELNPQSQQGSPKAPSRADAIARAQVWMPIDVRSMDIKAGPQEPGAFPFNATVTCDYVPKDLSGKSPKFVCLSGEDEMTVKYGTDNAEVFGEVGATRLLWALGFGADRTYPVRVICHGCPQRLGGIPGGTGEMLFDPATIERRMPGRTLENEWSWRELNKVKAKEGGAPQAHVDALKLLAVFLQHTDSKKQQQRIDCLEVLKEASNPCEHPLMLINDLGLTFGKANTFNANDQGVHLVAWISQPIWKPGDRCIANLPKSWTGTLSDPVISEAGRAFLADLLSQLSDDQVRALFEVSRVNLRLRVPGKPDSGFATVEEWAEVFKHKRAEIVDKRCDH
jgi:hypothetical protein